MENKSLYNILGVGKDASLQELKKSFYKLSKEHHPDKGGNEDRFKEVSKAYEILKDSELRGRYDKGEGVESLSRIVESFTAEIFRAFQEVIDNRVFIPEREDLFSCMQGVLREKSIDLQRDLDEIEAEISVIEDIIPRIKRGALIISYLQTRRQSHKDRIRKIVKEQDLLRDSVNYLEELEYEVNKEEEDE